jgi:hypothetical protein
LKQIRSLAVSPSLELLQLVERGLCCTVKIRAQVDSKISESRLTTRILSLCNFYGAHCNVLAHGLEPLKDLSHIIHLRPHNYSLQFEYQ